MPLIGPEPKPGDLIEIGHGIDWGVYVGHGHVVHLTGQDDWLSSLFGFRKAAVVRKDLLETVACGQNCKVNNKHDHWCCPYPRQKIVNAALNELGKRMDYKLTSANCERFATNLRYGHEFSDQGPKPKPGDLIEFDRGSDQHWGVYVGDGYVVHLTGQNSWWNFLFGFGKAAVVKKDRFETVACGRNYKVNKHDNSCCSYSCEKIVKAALDEVGKKMDYEPTSANCEHFATNLRYGHEFSDQGPKPKPGELIEFDRGMYQHWGVYVGDGYVVHLTALDGWSSLYSASEGTAVVKNELLETVAYGQNYKVNNKYDDRCRPYPHEKIVNAAWSEVGKKKYYKLTSDNCEHFATNLRYGHKFSDQVDNAKMYALQLGSSEY